MRYSVLLDNGDYYRYLASVHVDINSLSDPPYCYVVIRAQGATGKVVIPSYFGQNIMDCVMVAFEESIDI